MRRVSGITSVQWAGTGLCLTLSNPVFCAAIQHCPTLASDNARGFGGRGKHNMLPYVVPTRFNLVPVCYKQLV